MAAVGPGAGRGRRSGDGGASGGVSERSWGGCGGVAAAGAESAGCAGSSRAVPTHPGEQRALRLNGLERQVDRPRLDLAVGGVRGQHVKRLRHGSDR